MTDIITDAEEAGFASDLTQSNTFGESVRAYISRVRGGDMGALPSIAGLVVLFIVFNFANDRFLSNLNLANLITQAGSIIILAMALVPVLLLGEIDLSAGVAGGTSACVMGVLLVKHDQPWYFAVLAALAVGAVIGLAIGLLVAKLGIPSFVVTLAFFLGLQGIPLWLIGEGGSVRVNDPVISGIANENLSVMWGWISAIGIAVLFAAFKLLGHRRKVAANLQHQPFAVVIAQIASLAAVLLAVTYVLNENRSVNPNFPIKGIPYVLPLVVVLLAFWTFILEPHNLGSARLRRGWQRRGRTPSRHQRRPHPHLGVHGLLVDGCHQRHRRGVVRRQGLDLVRRRQHAAVRRRRGRHRRHEPVRRQGQGP